MLAKLARVVVALAAAALACASGAGTTASVPVARGAPKPGNCGDTAQDMSAGACDRELTGSWNATALGITDLRGCVAACRKCSKCQYVTKKSRSQCVTLEGWFS